jgi:hypothetical protein
LTGGRLISLAWRRTGLALYAGLVVAARVFPGSDPWPAIASAAAALVIGWGMFSAARRRSRRLDSSLRGHRPNSTAPGGRLMLATAAFTITLAAAAAWWVLRFSEPPAWWR